MTAEQWLTDLGAKARMATPGPWFSTCTETLVPCVHAVPGKKPSNVGICVASENFDAINECNMDYIAAANPSAVLRLVGMVRSMAEYCAERGCPHGCPAEQALPLEECASCWIAHVCNVTQTEMSKDEPIICDGVKVADTADIDEILRLRAEVERLLADIFPVPKQGKLVS